MIIKNHSVIPIIVNRERLSISAKEAASKEEAPTERIVSKNSWIRLHLIKMEFQMMQALLRTPLNMYKIVQRRK